MECSDRKEEILSEKVKSSKEDKQFAVSKAVLEVIEKEGLLGVTHSKVSRKSKVSRAWIYEYVGKEKSDLIHFAADVLGSYFARANRGELPQTRSELENQLKDGTDFLFDSVSLSPVTVHLYFRFRGTKNPLGAVISKYENQWLKKASQALKQVLELPKEQAELLADLGLTLRLGFAHRYITSTHPTIDKEKAKLIFSYIHSMLSNL